MNSPTTHTGDRGLTCEDVIQHMLTEKYVSGELSEQQATEYEQHYFTCARCFEELQAYQTVQRGLQQAAPRLRAAEAPRAQARHWVPRWAFLAAAAALLLAASVMLLRAPRPTQTAVSPRSSPPPASSQPPSVQGPTGQPPTTATSPALLAELGRISPPPYHAVVLRGVQDEGRLQFERAMRHYQRGNYPAAVLGLQAALRLDASTADTNFYLGVSYLLSGQIEKAIEQLRRTSQLPDRTYAAQAHFYLAKVYLQKEDVPNAASELKEVTSSGGEHAHEAQTILRKLQATTPDAKP